MVQDRKTRRDEIGIVASERLQEVEAELASENARLREVVDAQSEQLVRTPPTHPQFLLRFLSIFACRGL